VTHAIRDGTQALKRSKAPALPPSPMNVATLCYEPSGRNCAFHDQRSIQLSATLAQLHGNHSIMASFTTPLFPSQNSQSLPTVFFRRPSRSPDSKARIKIKNRRKHYLDLHPEYFSSSSLELAGLPLHHHDST